MKRIIVLMAILASVSIPAAISQNNKCDAITSRVSETLSKGGGVSLHFVSTTTAGNRLIQEMAGNIKIKGKKFVMHSSVMDIGYDGKTAWSYIKGSDEVNLTEPTEEELVTINPYILLSNYKKIYKAEYKGKKEGCYIISFAPVSVNSDIKNATVSVDSERHYPTRLEIVNRDASKTVINISKYESAGKTDDSIFSFSKKNYPNAEIIDLR